MKCAALAQELCEASLPLGRQRNKTAGLSVHVQLGEWQRGDKENMNDGHATKALPETFRDNCPQRMCPHPGRYQPQKPFDVI